MSRCYICDYHPTNPSEYHGGLTLRHYGRKPHMHFDEQIQQYICTDCLSYSQSTFNELWFEPDADLMAYNKQRHEAYVARQTTSNELPIIIVPANDQE